MTNTNCNICGEKNDIQNRCKLCQKEYNKQYRKSHKEEIQEQKKQYRLKNKETINEYNKQYQLKNKEYFKIHAKQYYFENKEIIKEQKKQYYTENKAKRNEHFKNKRLNNLFFRLRSLLSCQVNKALKKNYATKNNVSCLKVFPFTLIELQIHLENQFEPWMSWDNYGKYSAKTWNDNDPTTWKWNIDHIIPQSDLPYMSMEDENFKKCWSLDNLRPLSAKQNFIDGVSRMRHAKENRW